MSSLSVLRKCLDKGLTMAFAESMTGGGACYEMIKNPGASKVVKGGMITYQEELKSRWLDVDANTVLKYGIVSLEVSRLMAKNIQEKSNASIGIGITGNAGPTTQDDTQGLVCFVSIYYNNTFTDQELVFEDLTREEAIELTIDAIYQKLDEML